MSARDRAAGAGAGAGARGPWPLTWRTFLETLGVSAGAVQGAAPATVTGAAYDSRRAGPGDAFFALPGLTVDGRKFARPAVERGAVAVVTESATGVRDGVATEAPPAEVLVGEARRALAQAALRLYRDPSSRLALVGLTGTNGKTTTSYLCRAALEAAGVPAGLVGTTGYGIGAEMRPATHTTPEAPELFDLLDEMSASGLKAAVIEVSSHALELRRAYGLTFASVVFTNLTRDHLDFHGSEEAYLAAKCRLFNGENGGETRRSTAIVNASDPHAGRVLAACAQGGMQVVRFALEGAPGAADAELVARDVALSPGGSRFTLLENGQPTPIDLPLPGRHNVENALAAWGAVRALGARPAFVAGAFARFAGVPGRLERIDAGQSFTVLVDYAHTPDALGRALAAVRETLAPGARLGVVFGCGGDRDRGKRAAMGEAAVRAADHVVVTDDNPRHENPAVIRGEAMKGARAAFRDGLAPSGADEPVEIAGRRRAIDHAVAWARAGDALLIAGKGHEGVQMVGEAALPFDDRAEALEAIEARGAR